MFKISLIAFPWLVLLKFQIDLSYSILDHACGDCLYIDHNVTQYNQMLHSKHIQRFAHTGQHSSTIKSTTTLHSQLHEIAYSNYIGCVLLALMHNVQRPKKNYHCLLRAWRSYIEGLDKNQCQGQRPSSEHYTKRNHEQREGKERETRR